MVSINLLLIGIIFITACAQLPKVSSQEINECSTESFENCNRNCEDVSDCKQTCPCGPININEECDLKGTIVSCLPVPGKIECIGNTYTFVSK